MKNRPILLWINSFVLLVTMLVLSGCSGDATVPEPEPEPITAPNTAPADVAEPALGQPAPDFTLKTIDGRSITLSELTEDGPVVLLMLRGYPGYQCPICSRQVGDYLSNAQAFAQRNASVVMVYPGPSEGLTQHADDFIAGRGLPDQLPVPDRPGLHLHQPL